MTKASPARLERRRLGLGRPHMDVCADPDRIKVEFALGLQAGCAISERKAFDLVVCHFESRAVDPSKMPRNAGAGLLVGYETQPARTVAGRARSLRRKIRIARPDVVAALTLALRCGEVAAAGRLFEALSALAAVAPPARVRHVVRELEKAGRELPASGKFKADGRGNYRR